MKRFYNLLGFTFLSAVILSFTVDPAFAQDKAAPAKSPAKASTKKKAKPLPPKGDEVQPITLNIAVVDVDSIRRQAKVVNNIGLQIKKIRETFQAVITKDEKKLRESQDELRRQEAILAEDAFKENVKKFQKKLQAVQIKVQQLKQQLAKAQGESMRKVEMTLNEIIDDLVVELNLHLVFRREPVVYYNQGLDITKLVLERLDKKLPSLKLPAVKIPTGKLKAKAKPKAKPKAKAKAPAAKK